MTGISTKKSTDEPDESAAEEAGRAIAPTGGLGEHLNSYVQRVRGGDMGSLPAVGGLIILVAIFWIVHPTFGSRGNFANVLQQSAPSVFIAMGLVFVLLIAEIDLSAGTAAGVCACLMARVSQGYNWPWLPSIAIALACGVAIGFFTGFICAKIRIPSFVVTLALFLSYQGIVLYIVNNGAGMHGNITIGDNFIGALDNGQMPDWAGWLMVVVMLAGYALVKIYDAGRRVRAGLQAEPIALIGLKVGGLAAISVVAVWLLNSNRATNAGQSSFVNQGGKIVKVSVPALEGVPYVVPLTLVVVVILTFVLSRTRYGRHVYAVGGNPEAARRAGIPVDRVRISVFMIGSLLASIGGVLLASQVRGVDQGEGGGNVLLLAVAAAVVGGTSLFGGRGRAVDAVIGGLVLGVIANGMSDLVQGNNGQSVQFIVTGAVLLLAAAIDALARRRASSHGLS